MYRYFETFLFRTPFFPFSDLSNFEAKQHEPVFREMLQIATPDLSEGMEKESDKVRQSAYRYYQRACTRPTPFGLFAGCSLGIFAESTDIQLFEQNNYKRITRLDMNYICALTQQIEKNRDIRQQLHYYPNNSMYSVGNHIRYVEYNYRKTRRLHQITQVEISEYLEKALTAAKGGACFSELTATLVDDEITIETAAEFIHNLIDSQILVSELEPAVTNVQPLNTLIEKIRDLPNTDNPVTDILLKIESLLGSVDSQPIGSTGNIYPVIIEQIEKTNLAADIKYLFQTDMFKPVQQATISRNIIKDIQQALLFLNKTNSSTTRNNLSQFKDNFQKRYEDREMPLLFVLDNELGIGYAGNTSGDISPLVDDLAVVRGYSHSSPPPSIQSVLLQRYQQSLQNVIELTDDDVKGAVDMWDDLPLTISVLCQILQDNDSGRSVYVKSASGHSAANLLGRFCHLDEQILSHTLAITEKEAQLNPNVIFAEIVHLPESRIGNILLRPVLRPYEISYLAKSGVTEEFELRPEDLYVSVKENRIVLRSIRLKNEIIPRMSSAHNYNGQNPMPVYNFLCDLQHQTGRTGLWFLWNDVAQSFDYLPRVVYKNCILSKARWTIHEKETKSFLEIKEDDELLRRVKEWKKLRNIPDTVLLSDGDNELYIDLHNTLSIRAWLSIVKKRQTYYLEELLFNPETAIVHGPEGVFTNEFIFAFYKKTMTKKE